MIAGLRGTNSPQARRVHPPAWVNTLAFFVSLSPSSARRGAERALQGTLTRTRPCDVKLSRRLGVSRAQWALLGIHAHRTSNNMPDTAFTGP